MTVVLAADKVLFMKTLTSLIKGNAGDSHNLKNKFKMNKPEIKIIDIMLNKIKSIFNKKDCFSSFDADKIVLRKDNKIVYKNDLCEGREKQELQKLCTKDKTGYMSSLLDGFYCGYVALRTKDIPRSWHGDFNADGLQYLSIHGGITFCELVNGINWSFSIPLLKLLRLTNDKGVRIIRMTRYLTFAIEDMLYGSEMIIKWAFGGKVKRKLPQLKQVVITFTNKKKAKRSETENRMTRMNRQIRSGNIWNLIFYSFFPKRLHINIRTGKYIIFGFDCAHVFDFEDEKFKDSKYIMKLVETMEQQLIDYAGMIEIWRRADKEEKNCILDDIISNAKAKSGLGFGGMLGMLFGMKEFD